MSRGRARKTKRSVFLDRDGTLNHDPGYLKDANRFRFLPRVKQALRLLSRNGFELLVVTNQSGIGRGWITRRDVDRIHAKMRRDLKKAGVRLRAVLYCPHAPSRHCKCRKPSPLLIRRAAGKYGLSMQNSFMVGDKHTDIQTGIRAGLRTVLVGGKRDKASAAKPDHACRDLLGAAKWIVRWHRARAA